MPNAASPALPDQEPSGRSDGTLPLSVLARANDHPAKPSSRFLASTSIPCSLARSSQGLPLGLLRELGIAAPPRCRRKVRSSRRPSGAHWGCQIGASPHVDGLVFPRPPHRLAAPLGDDPSLTPNEVHCRRDRRVQVRIALRRAPQRTGPAAFRRRTSHAARNEASTKAPRIAQ